MSADIEIDGKTYIPSKRASELTGYSQDYIGQLARGGYIDARRVGGLWHVSLESVQDHEKKAQIAKAQQSPSPQPKNIEQQDIDSIVAFDGIDYISAARAAHLTGYHPDYVAQLARAGTVTSRQIGNRWYVGRESILKHKSSKDELLGAVQSASVGIERVASPEVGNVGRLIAEDHRQHFTYTRDENPLRPEISLKYSTVTSGIASQENEDREIAVPIRVNKIAPTSKAIEPTSAKGMNSTRVTRRLPLKILLVSAGLLAAFAVGYGIYFATMRAQILNNPNAGAATSSGSELVCIVGEIVEKLFVKELRYQRTKQ